MAGIIIKPRARILHGHEWVYASEILKTFGKPADGDVISIKDGRDRMLGSAIYNSQSQIVARRFSRQRQDPDADFFQRRIRQAIEYRGQFGQVLAHCGAERRARAGERAPHGEVGRQVLFHDGYRKYRAARARFTK